MYDDFECDFYEPLSDADEYELDQLTLDREYDNEDYDYEFDEYLETLGDMLPEDYDLPILECYDDDGGCPPDCE